MINEQPALEQAIERALEVQSRLWRVAAKDLANAIRAEIVRLMDERDDNAYLAAVAPQPEPPAQPAFAVGDRVQNIEGDMTGTVVSVDNEGFEVLFDGRTKPNPFRLGTKFVEPLMPQSTPERVEWAEYVILYPVGSRVSVYERGNGTIVAHGHVAHIAFDDKDTMVYPAKWESVKPLSEPAPAALPEGVTRTEYTGNPRNIVYRIPEVEDEPEANFILDWNVGSNLIGLRYTDQYIIFNEKEFENFLIAGQALKKEIEAQNGR
jgi:hypothetical protein